MTNDNVHGRVEIAAAKYTHHVAIVCEEHKLTYGELITKANIVANYLIEIGVTSKSVVAFQLERSIEAVVLILGTLKAGASYLPIEMNTPTKRLEQMIKIAKPEILVVYDQVYFNDSSIKVKKVHINEIFNCKFKSASNVNITPTDDHAYVLFTSGSTGQPKSIQGKHKTIINRIDWMNQKYPILMDDVFFLRTSLTFVDSVWDIFQPLMYGGLLVIATDAMMHNHDIFLNEIEKRLVTRLSLTPSHLRSLFVFEKDIASRLKSIKLLDITGEQLNGELALLVCRELPFAQIINRYGCTEAPSVTWFDVRLYDNHFGPFVPIGSAISNTELIVLNELEKPVQPGEVGELYVAGHQVAEKYLGDEQLTNTSFITIEYEHRLINVYRTGDNVKVTGENNLICLGRKDNQININGRRIDLEEIEINLKNSGMIAECAVIHSVNQILAFYSDKGADETVPVNKLQDSLRRVLPPHMLPQKFIKVNKFYYLDSGKINKTKLKSEYESKNNQKKLGNNKVTVIEKEILNILGTICPHLTVNIEDDFFDLGLDSLSLIELVSIIKKRFGTTIDLKDVFLESTVERLANVITKQIEVNQSPDLNVTDFENENEFFTMSYAQRLLWRLDQNLGSYKSSYNDFWPIELTGNLNYAALKSAFQDLIENNGIFRTSYHQSGSNELQYVSSAQEISIETNDISSLSEVKQKYIIREKISDEQNYTFNLSKGPLLKIGLLKLGQYKHLLFICTHHITEDAWSGKLINKELSKYYNFRINNDSVIDNSSQNWSYLTYSLWQNQKIKSGDWDSQLRYWINQLSGYEKSELVRDYHISESKLRFDANEKSLIVDYEKLQTLKRISKEERSTMFMTLLTTLFKVLSEYTGEQDLVIGSPIAHRHYNNVESIIGFFPNMLPFRQFVQKEIDFRKLLSFVRKTVIEGFSNQDVPFVKVMDSLGRKIYRTHPFVNVTFAYRNNYERVGQGLTLKDISSKLMEYESRKLIKFDMSFTVLETKKELQLTALYNTSVIKSETVDTLLNKINNLINTLE